MSKKQTEQELSSFKDAVKHVKRMKNDRIDLYAHPENTRPFKDKNQYDEGISQSDLSDEWQSAEVSGEEFIFFARPGLQLKTQKQLRQGKIILKILTQYPFLQENFLKNAILRCIRLVLSQ